MDEINQKEDFDPTMEFLLGGQTCPGGLPDKFEKPYWDPVEAGHIW
jgi:hypothetical protein